jgi:UDP-3-O-[3-hydroxymyristoyl] glucosamine N-acyltransferase
VEVAGAGDLAVFAHSRYARAARRASERGAALLVDDGRAKDLRSGARWVHPHAWWAMAELLDEAGVPDTPATWGEGCEIGEHVVLGPRVVIGARVRIGAGAVIGRPGFGWADGPDGRVRAIPQLGGVIIEDDAVVGPLCTVDAGTLAPTVLRRGVKLDAHCHVGHNCVLGEGTIVAAQSGFAGSVVLGRGVLVGGQVGIADHVHVGDGARIAAKSGVIGDVPPGAVVAGYPAVPRVRWLRALARLYRGLSRAP